MRSPCTVAFVLVGLALSSLTASRCRAQAALLMEEPYGFFGAVNPTGHTAIYFERICAETPVTLRRCRPGEAGAVISRYQGIGGYDWIAIPLLPYLYSVESVDAVPERVDRQIVERLRNNYHEKHLLDLGNHLRPGNMIHGGWTEFVGVAYERRIYAFRFATTEEQDDAFVAKLNGSNNHSDFDLLFNNCSDFARAALNEYFPGTFKRSIFPDAGMTTPKQIAFKLERYARKHAQTGLAIYEIPQIPGYRHLSRHNKSISESLVTSVYAVPIAILNPYLAGGLFVDYIVRGRYHPIPKHPEILGSDNLAQLTSASSRDENSDIAPPSAAVDFARETVPAADAGLKEINAEHE